MRLPTVRIKHPAHPDTYAVINQSDLKPGHELWPEQAHDYVEAKPVTESENSVAVRILGKLMAKQAGIGAQEWAAMPSATRAALMVAEEPKIDSYVASGVLGSLEPRAEADGTELPARRQTRR